MLQSLSLAVTSDPGHSSASSPASEDAVGEVTNTDAAPAGGFLSETLAELGRVVWPTRQQLLSESLSVILMVALSAAAIAASNRLFGWISDRIFLV